MTQEKDLLAELEALRAENEKLKRANTPELTCKVSKSGGVSVYGLGRFPVTLYQQQWSRLIEFAPKVKQFIEDNRESLSVKK